jgi:hypothetical protein
MLKALIKDTAFRFGGVDTHTTSCDGFVLATSPNVEPLFGSFSLLGRLEIARSSSRQLLDSLAAVRI